MFAAVSVVALVLSCVAIALFTTHKSDATNDDYEKRFQEIELKLPSHGKVDTPEVSEIKPVDVFQISIYRDTYGAELAIDRDEDTHMTTNSHTNPWWCADMGGIFHVKRVVITNINNDRYTYRATNLRVGVTNARPVIGQSLALDAYTLCEEKPGLMGKIGIVTCPDGVSGQYLKMNGNLI